MPALRLPEQAFTVINHEERSPRALARARSVNVVRPLPRDAPLDPHFTRALDYKLRRLKRKEMQQAASRRPRAHHASEPDVAREHAAPAKAASRSYPHLDALARDKPRFVTTVKSGQFLLPPPPLARLLGLQSLYPAPPARERVVYEYANRPEPVASRARRPAAAATRVGDAFRGVRALVAGVAGVRQQLERRDHVGSLATGAAGATGATGATSAAGYSNLMHEKRVVRGSTFGAHPHAAGDGSESNAARAARTRRRALARRAALARLRPGTPPPAPGRRHLPVQTELYLEELFDKGAELEAGVQTDLFADRPATPLYVPASTGADAATQIYPGDLFDFDVEVQPILEVLVGKTAEQALGEVAQEEELAALREQQRRYRELRDAELAERRRLGAADERLARERERRVAEARAARAAGEEARARVAAAALVQGYVAELLPGVLAGLRDSGYLLRRLHAGVEDEFMPWLVREVSHEIESIITSRDVLTEIVRDVVEARAELFGAAGERVTQRVTPPDSLTPRSLPDEEELEE